MATQKDELAEKTKAKIIELFGPESALAQAMEDDDFLDKLGELIAWLYGEIILSQPRPEPPPRFPGPRPLGKPWERPWEKKFTWQTTAAPGSFTHKLQSAISKYEGKL